MWLSGHVRFTLGGPYWSRPTAGVYSWLPLHWHSGHCGTSGRRGVPVEGQLRMNTHCGTTATGGLGWSRPTKQAQPPMNDWGTWESALLLVCFLASHRSAEFSWLYHMPPLSISSWISEYEKLSMGALLNMPQPEGGPWVEHWSPVSGLALLPHHPLWRVKTYISYIMEAVPTIFLVLYLCPFLYLPSQLLCQSNVWSSSLFTQ